MSKAKRFKLITTITLIFTFLFTNIKVFAVEITSTDAESYLNYDSPTWGKVLPIGNHRYYVPGDLTTCYCLNTGALNPTGQDYTKEMQIDAGIETILYWGYPAKDGSDWGISADEYRYCTQLAIWVYQKEAGLSRGLVRERLQSGTVPLSKLKPVIDFLVDKAHNKEMPTFFEVSPNDIIAHQEGDYFVSEPIKIKSNYTLSGVKVTIKSASNPELTKDIVIKDMDGNVKDSGYKANESFRVYIPSNAETGDLKVSVKAKVDIPAMLGYMTPEQGIQDMAVSSLDTHSMDKDNIKVSWTRLNGAVQVIKKGDDGKLLTGAKFVLKNANGENVAEATSQDGKAVFNDIKAGDYTIEEIEAPEGYLIANAVNVTVKPNKATQAEMIDNKIRGKVAVKKVDKETNKILQGAEFTIYDGDKAVQTITTDENGYAESGLLNYGKYTMKETKAPNGYLVNDNIWNINITENDKTYTFDVPDQIIKGKIQVLKIDEENQKPLQGAEFEITQNGKHIETITTNEKGIAMSGLLPFGDYVVKEIKAPNKYVLNGQEHPVTISENGKTIEITHTNKIIKGKVAVKKTDSELADLNLEGAEFTIYDGDKAVQTITTDKNGYAESGLLNYGKYTMKETKAPNGYLVNDKVWNIDITENEKTYTYDISDNVIKGKLQIVKVDSENEEKLVANAEFDVVAKNVFGVKEGTVVDHVVTDKDGFAYTKDLRFGEYEFKEVKTPQGYWKSDKVYNFNITENGKTYVKYVKNSPIQAKVRVVKTDSTNNKPIAGVKFQIRNMDTDKLVEFKNFIGIIPMKTTTLETNKNGELVTPQVLSYGHYQLEEVEAPEGYNTIKPISFKIDENANLESIEDLGVVYTVKVKNDRITSNMEMLKIDSETKKPLNGVSFRVTALDGFMKGKTWDLTSNEEGKIALKNLEYGHYQIQEIKTLWNYVLNKEPINFEVKENGQNIKLEITNKKIRGSVEVFKFDKDTNRPLEGVKFDLFNEDKKIGTYTTDKNGKITVSNLEAGKYTWVEVEPIDHYNKVDKKYDFNIYKDGQLEKLEVANTVKVGELDFTKTDVTNGKVIDGAKIKITGLEAQNKHIIIEFTSSKEGNKFNLPEGKYEFKEVTAPEGYKLNKEVGTFEIKDGQITKANLKNERKTGTVNFTKTDVTTGEVIEGAKIKITCVEGLSKGKVFEFTSSKEGNNFTLDEGKYEFKEVTAPEGYNLNEEIGTFEIKDGQITKTNLKDTRTTGKLIFKKTDVATGNILEGATIKIECIEGLDKGKVIEFVSKKEGNEFELTKGKYRISETKAPEGYELTTETGEFEITNQGDIIKCNLTNKKIKIVKTGSSFDINSLIPLGILLVAGGIGGLFFTKKKKLS